jgi:hypothetical protein
MASRDPPVVALLMVIDSMTKSPTSLSTVIPSLKVVLETPCPTSLTPV